MAKIIGIQKQEGVYEGHPYCNYSFTCYEAYSDKIPNSYGGYVRVHKGKCDVLDQWLKANNLDIQKLLGQNASFMFDDRGKVVSVTLG